MLSYNKIYQLTGRFFFEERMAKFYVTNPDRRQNLLVKRVSVLDIGLIKNILKYHFDSTIKCRCLCAIEYMVK